MPVPFVVPAYAAILAFIYIYFAARVIGTRRRMRVSLGDGGDPALQRAIRVHGNFAEYVPLALLLLTYMEMQRNSIYALHLLCIILILARLSHALGVGRASPNLAFRAIGVVGTFFVIVVAAVVVLVDYVRIAQT